MVVKLGFHVERSGGFGFRGLLMKTAERWICRFLTQELPEKTKTWAVVQFPLSSFRLDGPEQTMFIMF